MQPPFQLCKLPEKRGWEHGEVMAHSVHAHDILSQIAMLGKRSTNETVADDSAEFISAPPTNVDMLQHYCDQ